MVCFEGRLVFVTLFDTYVVISPSYVQLGEYRSSPKIRKEVRDEGKRILISDGVLVEMSVVLDWS